jgi:alpha-tubulin suppressor-like RCC1 family protein
MRARRLLPLGAASTVVTGFLACLGDDPATPPTGALALQDAASESASIIDAGGAGDSAADGSCGDLATDPKNCGTCGHQCTGSNGCFRGVCGNVPLAVRGGPTSQHLCAVLADGTVWCWGLNDRGQLGTGDPTDSNRNVATRVTKDQAGNVFDHVVDVAVGGKHTCALKDDKQLYCWGDNSYLQVAPMTGLEIARAPVASTLANVQAVRAGGDHSCAIDGSNGVRCWGKNLDGALGHTPGSPGDTTCPPQTATTPCSGLPTPVLGVSNVTALALGDGHSCALTMGASVECWGANDSLQLAVDAGPSRATPGSTNLEPSTKAIFASYKSTCALGTTGTARCWGNNVSGELATGGRAVAEAPTPWGPDGGVAALSEMSGGAETICAHTTGGGLLCAGFNGVGECGDGTLTGPDSNFFHLTPSAVVGPDAGTTPLAEIVPVVQVASATRTNCALTKAGEIYCWGVGMFGQLGHGTNVDRQPRPVKVLGLPP